jgi:long-chain acyl-CoA synthetase
MASTLIGIFLDTVTRHARSDLFLRKHEGRWEPISAERAREDVEALGTALMALGVGRGDRVGLLSENRYEWAVADLAILGIGAVTVPIYPTSTAAQIRFVLENSGARAVIVSTPAQLDKVREGGAPGGLAIALMDASASLAGAEPLAALLERGRERQRRDAEGFRRAAAAVQPGDLATIIYTSGTTGDPKGAMLSHGNIASNVEASLQVIHLGPEDRCLSFLPLSHIFERMAGLYAMLAGGVSIAYAQSLDTVAADAVEVKPTVLIGVPRFYEKVMARVLDNVRTQPPLRQRIFHWGLQQGLERARAHFQRRRLDTFVTRLADRLVGSKVRARVGGRIRFCVSGGAALAPDVMEFLFAMGIPVNEGYGLTETSPVICLNPPGREKPGAVGPPIPGVEVRIGDDGEILTRGPHVMLGYYRNEAATQAALRDGWFHTGDVGRLDDEGYLFITDRLKDLLVTAGGKKVAPQPIEARLKTSKWVSEAVLIGDARPYVVALLVPHFSNLEAEARANGWPSANADELLARPEVRALYQTEVDRVNGDLARFEQIKSFTLLDRELTQDAGELTPTLKVKRRVIAERFGNEIEALYARHAAPAA